MTNDRTDVKEEAKNSENSENSEDLENLKELPPVVKKPSINELLKKYPKGFTVSPQGDIRKVIYATHSLNVLEHKYPELTSKQAFLVVEREKEVSSQD